MNAHAQTRPVAGSGYFYAAMGLVIALLVYLGFAPTFYARAAALGPVSTVQLVHGVILSLWVVLFIAQASLMGAGRARAHMRLGVLGAALALAVVIATVFATIDAARRGAAPIPGMSSALFLSVPVVDLVLIALFLAVGLASRKHRPETHKRMMFVAAALIASPGWARMVAAWDAPVLLAMGPLAIWLATLLLILAGAVFDLATQRRVHAAYVWSGALIVVSVPLRFVIAATPQWTAFAEWLKG